MQEGLASSINMSPKKHAAILSLVCSIFVFGLKILAYHWTHSTAIFSDALETVVNVIAAVVALFVIQYVSAPADDDHPYGHGKVEYFSAAFEGGLIFFAALIIFVKGVIALINNEPLNPLEGGLVLITAASIANLILALYLKKVGREQKSETLLASGAHIMSDVVTSAGVLLGLALVFLTGWVWLDSVVAITLAFNLAWEGYKIVRRSISALIDGVDLESLKQLSEAFEKNRIEGVINIHKLKAIRSGSFHHVDAHLVVPEFWDVRTVHGISHEFEKAVVKDYPFDGEIAFHIDPCQRKYCRICTLKVCPIRLHPFEVHQKFNLQDLMHGPL